MCSRPVQVCASAPSYLSSHFRTPKVWKQVKFRIYPFTCSSFETTTVANSEDTGEIMQDSETLLGLHCLLKQKGRVKCIVYYHTLKLFFSGNSVHLNEMLHFVAFIWIFYVCPNHILC